MSHDYLMNNYGPSPLTLIKGEGSYLYDDKNNKYIDFTSGIAVNSLGYNDPDWTTAITEQVTKLQHVSNLFYNDSTLKLCKKIVDLSGMDKVFLCNSGAEANEAAFKLARKYSFEKYGENRNVILSLKQSFHGRTMAALTATGQDKFHNYFFPFPQGFNYVEANNIEDFKNKLTDEVCAIIMEPIQGEGGVNPLDVEFVKEVSNICNSKDILVIFDEVQTGIGRTGKLFGYENFNVKADIITMAKGLGGGLPIGGILCTEKLGNVFKPGDHGTTFGGNPIACAGANVVLGKVANDDFLKSVNEKGDLIKSTLENANLSKVLNIRGLGLLIGIEVSEPPATIKNACMESGLLVLTAGLNTIRIAPPLTISKEDLMEGLNILIEKLI